MSSTKGVCAIKQQSQERPQKSHKQDIPQKHLQFNQLIFASHGMHMHEGCRTQRQQNRRCCSLFSAKSDQHPTSPWGLLRVPWMTIIFADLLLFPLLNLFFVSTGVSFSEVRLNVLLLLCSLTFGEVQICQ